jgi:hypothetical protein
MRDITATTLQAIVRYPEIQAVAELFYFSSADRGYGGRF